MSSSMFKLSSDLTDLSMAVLLCGLFLLYHFLVSLYYTVLSVNCSLVITCWERADLCDVSYFFFFFFFFFFYLLTLYSPRHLTYRGLGRAIPLHALQTTDMVF